MFFFCVIAADIHLSGNKADLFSLLEELALRLTSVRDVKRRQSECQVSFVFGVHSPDSSPSGGEDPLGCTPPPLRWRITGLLSALCRRRVGLCASGGDLHEGRRAAPEFLSSVFREAFIQLCTLSLKIRFDLENRSLTKNR